MSCITCGKSINTFFGMPGVCTTCAGFKSPIQAATCIRCGKAIKTHGNLPGMCIDCCGFKAPDAIQAQHANVRTVIIYDAEPTEGSNTFINNLLEGSWSFGSYFSGLSTIVSPARAGSGGFDGALRYAASQLGPDDKVKEIQFWCHGGVKGDASTGRAVGIKCGKQKLVTIDKLNFSVFKGRFTSKGGIWIRACWQGVNNEAAMARVCEDAGCQFIAGHKCVIDVRHSEMYLFNAWKNSTFGPRTATCSPATSLYDVFYDVM